MRRHLVLALVLLAACVSAFAAEIAPTVELSVNPQQATVGELLTATVAVTAPSGVTLTLPKQDADVGDAEVRSFTSSEETLPDGSQRTTLTYGIVLWEVGEKTVKAPPITWRAGDGEAKQADRPKATVTIISVLPPDAKDIQDIRPPREIPLRPIHYLLAMLPVLALVGLVWAGVAAIRRRRRPPEAEEVAPPLSPYDEAMLALDDLAAEDLPGRNRVEEHYVRLSWIIRNYIERRWRLPALEETTGMMAVTMRASGAVPEEQAVAIVALLRHADLAKFAKHRPGAEVARADVDEARRIVAASRPEPQPVVEEGET